ncbi:MAG: hypothetical protein AAFS10_22965, partial [Myxococcota bacterium]
MSGSGTQMQCAEGVCAEPSCDAGSIGCPCLEGGTCEGGLTCTAEGAVMRCVDEDCPTGQDGCACQLDRSCDAGLACIDNRCSEPECPIGTEGCACSQNLTCAGGLVCNADAQCEAAPDCTAGSYGCACDGDQCDAADAVCTDGTCQRADCPEGEEGCACGPQQRCGRGGDGAKLACVEGLCQSPSCAPGDLGCVCAGGTTCNAPGSSCVEGYCTGEACVAGQENCLCTGGTCGPGLRCNGGVICVDNTGYAQGACLPGDDCYHGGRCQRDVCVVCSLGSQGCDCRDDNTCNPGLECDASLHCVDTRGLAVDTPEEQVCYTPCSEGFDTDDGRYVPCPADGLMRGCFGTSSCTEGQCLQANAELRTCANELDCPDFQTCLAGTCGSNCDTSEDCVAGSSCFRHVCRNNCTVADADQVCGSSSYCHLIDGESGVCKMNVPNTGSPDDQQPIETFTLDTDAVSLTNSLGEGQLLLTNNNPQAVEFTLVRRAHRVYDNNGGVEEIRLDSSNACAGPQCPMWWVMMESDTTDEWSDAVQTITLASDESTTITIH